MPGVPPDAVDNVKKLLKGIFRRGRNKKQDQPQPTETAAPTQPPATNTTSSDKPIPPTQPLVSGQHDKPQEAIPIDHAAKPGPPPQAGQEVKQEPGSGDISPRTPAPAAAPVAGAESDVTASATPAVDSSVPKADEVPGTKESVPAPTPAAPVQPESTVASAGATAVKTSDANGPAQSEPPVVPKTQPAPGMSATSGPLEDYPEEHPVTEEERKN